MSTVNGDELLCICGDSFWSHKQSGKCERCVCKFFVERSQTCDDCSRQIPCKLMKDKRYRCATCVEEWSAYLVSMNQDPALDDALQAEHDEAPPPALYHVAFRIWGDEGLFNRVLSDVDTNYPFHDRYNYMNIRTCNKCNGFFWPSPRPSAHQVKLLANQCGNRVKVDTWATKCDGDLAWKPPKTVLEGMKRVVPA